MIGDNVPLYVDAVVSGTKQPTLSPDLIRQIRTINNLGDALHLLGPGYLASDDPTHIPRWYFANGQVLTLWPQGDEKMSDIVSLYPSPRCKGMPNCHELILSRQVSATVTMEQQYTSMPAEQHDANGAPIVTGPQQSDSNEFVNNAENSVLHNAIDTTLNTLGSVRFR
jgi:hypothetical protein